MFLGYHQGFKYLYFPHKNYYYRASKFLFLIMKLKQLPHYSKKLKDSQFYSHAQFIQFIHNLFHLFL